MCNFHDEISKGLYIGHKNIRQMEQRVGRCVTFEAIATLFSSFAIYTVSYVDSGIVLPGGYF